MEDQRTPLIFFGLLLVFEHQNMNGGVLMCPVLCQTPGLNSRRESAVVGEQLPMVGFVQGICMRLAMSGMSSLREDPEKQYWIRGTRCFHDKHISTNIINKLSSNRYHHKNIINKLSSHLIKQLYRQIFINKTHPSCGWNPTFSSSIAPAIDTAGWRCRIRRRSRDRLREAKPMVMETVLGCFWWNLCMNTYDMFMNMYIYIYVQYVIYMYDMYMSIYIYMYMIHVYSIYI